MRRMAMSVVTLHVAAKQIDYYITNTQRSQWNSCRISSRNMFLVCDAWSKRRSWRTLRRRATRITSQARHAAFAVFNKQGKMRFFY